MESAMQRQGLISGLVLILCSGSIVSAVSKRVPPVKLEQLACVWVGGELGDSLQYYRLELRTDGTGLLTVQQLPDSPTWAYRVTQTSLKQYTISFALAPVDLEAEPIFLRGTALPGRLRLEVGGTTLDWKRKIELEPLDHLMARLKAVTDRANVYRSQARE
jgi:hypothetical protein